MVLKFYYDLMSQPSRAIYLFLKVNSIPFESKIVALRKGEHLSPEFAKINPVQKVPVLDHDGFVLTESVAMMRYLSREYEVADHWYPKDSKAQARVDEYMAWQHLNTRLFGSMVFRTRVIDPMLKGSPVDEVKLKFYKHEFEKALDNIEKMFLKNRPYLCGDHITVADILGICEVDQPLLIGFDPVSSRPQIKCWMDRVKKDVEPCYEDVFKVTNIVKSAIQQGKL